MQTSKTHKGDGTHVFYFEFVCNFVRCSVPIFVREIRLWNKKLQNDQLKTFRESIDDQIVALKLRARSMEPRRNGFSRFAMTFIIDTNTCNKQIKCIILYKPPNCNDLTDQCYISRSHLTTPWWHMIPRIKTLLPSYWKCCCSGPT